MGTKRAKGPCGARTPRGAALIPEGWGQSSSSPHSTSDSSRWPGWAPCRLSSPAFYAEPQLGALLRANCRFAPFLTQPTTVTTWCQHPLALCSQPARSPASLLCRRCGPPPGDPELSDVAGPGSVPGPWAHAWLQSMGPCTCEPGRPASLTRARGPSGSKEWDGMCVVGPSCLQQ